MNVKNQQKIKFNNTTTEALYIDAKVVVGIITPNDLDFNNITLTVKVDKGNQEFVDLYDSEGNNLTIYMGSNRYIAINILDYIGISSIKFIANTDLDGKEIEIVTADVLR